MTPSPSRSLRYFAVDRIEQADGARIAVLVGDTGTPIDVPCSMLPAGITDGLVLRVPMTDAAPAWHRAEPDANETARRRSTAKRLQQELLREDPGGDLVL